MKDIIDAKLSSMEDKIYKKAFIGSYKLLSTLALVIRLALARILNKKYTSTPLGYRDTVLDWVWGSCRTVRRVYFVMEVHPKYTRSASEAWWWAEKVGGKLANGWWKVVSLQIGWELWFAMASVAKLWIGNKWIRWRFVCVANKVSLHREQGLIAL